MQVRVDNFGGYVQTKDPKKGPFWTALKASNVDVMSGSLDVAYSIDATGEQLILLFVGAIKTIFNILGASFSTWQADIDVALSPIADNSLKRIYFTGDGVPKATDAALATLGGGLPVPQVYYTLGLPIPKNFLDSPGAVVLAVTGGAAPVETRAYVYTDVSPWGEESAPSDPVITNGNSSGGTWRLRFIGALSGVFDGNGNPSGAPNGGLIGGNGVVTANAMVAATQFRVGNLVLFESSANATLDLYRAAHVVTAAGAFTLTVRTGCPFTAGAGVANVWRVGPINSYNIVAAVKDTPLVGQVKVSVDTVQGLRVGDKVWVNNVIGMTDLNIAPPGFRTVLAVSNVPNDVSFVVALATAQVYASGGEAWREAPYNTGTLRITNITIAAGVVTVTVDTQTGGTAHLAVGDKILIQGAAGAIEANGLRAITTIPTGGSFTFALAAMTAYTAGGIAVLSNPYPFTEYQLSNVAFAGGTFTFTINSPHDFVVGDPVMVYDVGGTVEANNTFVIATVAGANVTALSNWGAATAYTAGGKIVRVKHPCRKRIYRTNQSLAGTADFQLVAEISGHKCDYDDKIENTALGDILATSGWIQPPTDLVGIVAHPHGFLIGWSPSKRALCMSEPYQPHAFPIAYQRPLAPDIVGIGLFATTAVVLTKQRPVNVTGVHPSAMMVVNQDVGEPCTSKRSIASTAYGVIYRGTSGFFVLGSRVGNNATFNYLKATGFINVTDTVGVWWRNKYVWIDAGTQSGFIFDPLLEDKGLTQFDTDFPIYGLHVSPIDGQLWATYTKPGGGNLPYYAPIFKITNSPARFTYWTQYLTFAKPVTLGALQVDWAWDQQSAAMKDRENAIIRNVRRRRSRGGAFNDRAINTYAYNGDGLETIYSPDTTLTTPTEVYLRVTVIASPDKADVSQVVFDDFVVDDQPVRIDHGILADTYQVKLVGNAKVTAVSLAETPEELGLT